MLKLKAALAAVAITLGIVVPALVAAPANAYSDFIQHGPVGNPQSISVICTSDGSVKTLTQGQYSQDKCPFNGRVNKFYVAPGYHVCIRPYYNPGVGCQFSYSGGGEEPNQRPTSPRKAKIGRNDPCPCGSGKKYKKCHGMPGAPPLGSEAQGS